MLQHPDPGDDDGIADKGTEHEEDAAEHPKHDRRDPIGISGSVGDNIVEGVDKDEEGGDEEADPSRIDGGWDEEADPGDDDEHGGGQVIDQDIHADLATELELEPGH